MLLGARGNARMDCGRLRFYQKRLLGVNPATYGSTMMVPLIAAPCTRQKYGYVPATVKR